MLQRKELCKELPMKRFDPNRTREIKVHYAKRFLNYSFEEAKAKHTLSSVALFAGLNEAVACFLVGDFDLGRLLIVKARQWLSVAVETNEPVNLRDESPFGEIASRHRTLAMCNWLATGKHDAENLRLAIDFEERYLASDSPSRNRDEISFSLPSYVNPYAYERALKTFASCPKLLPPKSLNSIRGEARMCYVVCRHRLGREFSAEEADAALEGFLMRNVDSTWLADGHYSRAAEWMKIAHWRASDDPIAIVLRCYDYLPGRIPPAYPPAG
jgi:hypothetical protein